MDLKDKLNLAWKFLFLAVFTYGVVSVTCCSNSCSNAKQCSTTKVAKQCGPDCIKPCCAK